MIFIKAKSKEKGEFYLNIRTDCKIYDLKHKIGKSTQTPIDSISLSYNKIPFNDNNITIDLLKIKNGSEINFEVVEMEKGNKLIKPEDPQTLADLEAGEILVKFINEEYIFINIRSGLTVQNLKSLIFQEKGINCKHQKLFYKGIKMHDQDELKKYNITPGSLINCITRIKNEKEIYVIPSKTNKFTTFLKKETKTFYEFKKIKY